mgnify:CR=1 FL=1
MADLLSNIPQLLFIYIPAFLVVLSIIVFVHEYGHYSVAKLAGVKVEEFSIGFGKELYGWNDQSGTRWKISLIPLGGYVKMFGDTDPASNPDTDKIASFTKEEEKIAFHTQSLSKKTAIVAAGPLINFILGFVIFIGLYSVYGKSYSSTQLANISQDSAAYEAGLLAGDIITHIDNEPVESFADIQQIVALNTGTAMTLSIQRDGQNQTITITPKIMDSEDAFGNPIKRPILGIVSGKVQFHELGLIDSIKEAAISTYNATAMTLKALGQMISGDRSLKEISGPISIAKYSGQAAQMGIPTLLYLTALISINLGLVNLFPIPMLDGGHLLFYGIEAIQGRPLAERYQEWGLKFGMICIAMLMVFAVLNDIMRLF